jgi:hypothetical protein
VAAVTMSVPCFDVFRTDEVTRTWATCTRSRVINLTTPSGVVRDAIDAYPLECREQRGVFRRQRRRDRRKVRVEF